VACTEVVSVNRTRVALVVVDDAVYLPRVVGPLLADPRIELRSIVLLPLASTRSMHPRGSEGPGALVERIRLYGVRGFAALATLQFLERVRRTLGRSTLAALAHRHGVAPARWWGSVNAPQTVGRIRDAGSDIVLGVFSERAGAELCNAAPRGLLLLHYSLLPRFSGREPTFWTLLEDPDAGGVTFFKASGALDEGPVAAQAPCTLRGARSLHEAICQLSDAAGRIAADAVCRAAKGEVTAQASEPRKLYGWPTRSDVRRFRERGHRFA
jgi:methionyl-tRNA formyltransferase